ncbi:DUF3422 family protein [Rhodobaculum claviforme]|uniref:Membrane-anchored protein n=1 Tax=Rhodobaculum claviforme TaxID=1549854 RepID=A0A934WI77_9RHOB|nr:DUF3422 domain-containing protein [Rhodobaculum claviforme]MBK5926609.1 hypothetical protein [Rhodobaculum claviforme]
MPNIEDHPLRFTLANELHARPFPQVEAPCQVAYLAVKPVTDAARRDRGRDWTHLLALLDRFGAPHPPKGATHHFADLGRFRLKWESHTEFVTYTAFVPGVGQRPFDPAAFDAFPADWLEEVPGVRLTSILLRIDHLPDDEAEISARLGDWFVQESVACSRVPDAGAVIASDFRIDSAGHMRMGVFAASGVGRRRLGRLVQRLCEIETYKALSMLGFVRARELSPQIGELDTRLSRLVGTMTVVDNSRPEETLTALLGISSELENLLVKSSFRFSATFAYEAILHERIEVLREERMFGRQTLQEFMLRRFDPAMRTVKSADARLRNLADRSMRAGTLLGTRVDVDRSAQNQRLLESMDKRADTQLRLQRTVEGLSVVAISYYAVGLVGNLAAPLADPLGVGRGWLLAILTPPVVLAVWVLVHRIRAKLTSHP